MTEQLQASESFSGKPIRVAFVLHVMQVAGAEVLVAETIRKLGPRLDPVVFCLDAIGQLGEIIQKEGVPVINLGRRPGMDLRVSRRMAKEIGRRRIEVVHAHQYTPFFYSAFAKFASLRKFKLIFTEHGRHYPDLISPKRRLINRYLLSHCADEINAVCHFSAQALAECEGFPQKRIQVIENGIAEEKYRISIDKLQAKKQLDLDSSRRYLLCVARFHPVKDHLTLLHAFARIAKVLPDVDLLLAGDGPLRTSLEQKTIQLGIEQRVRFLGVRHDIPELMKAADLFVLTSVSEAASITLLEAMASSLPVVVTNVGGNPEIVRDGIDGFLPPRGNPEKIAEACIRLFSDADLQSRMAENGRNRVSQKYLLDQTIEAYWRLYADAADTMRHIRSSESI